MTYFHTLLLILTSFELSQSTDSEGGGVSENILHSGLRSNFTKSKLQIFTKLTNRTLLSPPPFPTPHSLGPTLVTVGPLTL